MASVLFAMLLCLTSGLLIAEGVDGYALYKRGCPIGWTKNNFRCFKYISELKTWTEAERHCITIGGNLASVHSIQENTIIRRLARNQHVWIGGYDVAHSSLKIRMWLFSDGSSIDYTYWHPNEPNNYKGVHERCLELWYQEKWNDERCYSRRRFVCARAI